MLLGLEIALVIYGIVLLARGRCKMGPNKHLTGPAVRLAGFLFLLPLPTAFVAGFYIAASQSAPGMPYRVQDHMGELAMIEVLIIVAYAVLGFLVLVLGGVADSSAQTQRNPFALYEGARQSPSIVDALPADEPDWTAPPADGVRVGAPAPIASRPPPLPAAFYRPAPARNRGLVWWIVAPLAGFLLLLGVLALAWMMQDYQAESDRKEAAAANLVVFNAERRIAQEAKNRIAEREAQNAERLAERRAEEAQARFERDTEIFKREAERLVEEAKTRAEREARETERVRTEERVRSARKNYALLLIQAERERLAKNPRQAGQLLKDCPIELRGWEWYHLEQLCTNPASQPDALVYPIGDGPVGALSLSPDGQRLAVAQDDRTVTIRDLTSGRILHVLKGHTEAVRALSWSPDGKHLVSAASTNKGNKPGELKLWDAEAGTAVHALTGHAWPVNGVAWCKDGQRLISTGVGSVNSEILVWDPVSAKVETRRIWPGSIRGMAVHPESGLLTTFAVLPNGQGNYVNWETPSLDFHGGGFPL